MWNDPTLRLAFFQTAAAVLLRPQPPADQDQGTAGIGGKYMVLRRLMPLFEQLAPRDVTAAVHGQLQALNSLVSEDLRGTKEEWVKRGLGPEPQHVEQERSLLDEIEHAKTAAERDQLYFKLAVVALNKDDLDRRSAIHAQIESYLHRALQLYTWFYATLEKIAVLCLQRKNLPGHLS